VDERIVALLTRRLEPRSNRLWPSKTRPAIYNPAREEDLISQRRDQARRRSRPGLSRCSGASGSPASARPRTPSPRASGPGRVLLAGGEGGRRTSTWFGDAGYGRGLMPAIQDRAACCATRWIWRWSPSRSTSRSVGRQLAHSCPPLSVRRPHEHQARTVAVMLESPGTGARAASVAGYSTSSMDQQIVVARRAGCCQPGSQSSFRPGNIVMTLSPQGTTADGLGAKACDTS
jgi:hypothetical protein